MKATHLKIDERQKRKEEKRTKQRNNGTKTERHKAETTKTDNKTNPNNGERAGL